MDRRDGGTLLHVFANTGNTKVELRGLAGQIGSSNRVIFNADIYLGIVHVYTNKVNI